MKFLINAEREYCAENRVIMTRLEASKLYKFIENRLFELKAFEAPIAERRIHYHNAYRDFCNFVILRDIFFNLDFMMYGRIVMSSDTLMPSFGRLVANIVSDALERTKHEVMIQDIFEGITDCLQGRFGGSISQNVPNFRHHFKYLQELDNDVIKRLIKTVLLLIEDRTKSALKIIIVYDGFDLLSPEDAHVDTDKLDLLKSILHSYNSLSKMAMGKGGDRIAAVTTGLPRDINHHALVLMRNNTYSLLVEPENPETFVPSSKLDSIEELSADVVMFRAFTRASEQLSGHLDVPSDQVSVNGAFTLIQDLLSRIGTGIQNEEKTRYHKLYNLKIFDGNLRDCFRAVKRLLELIAEEGIADAQIGERPNLNELLRYAESRPGAELAHWRGYRVPEVLLLGHRTHFTNAMCSRSPSSPTRIVKAQSFDSLFDNVFDYFGDLYDYRLGMHNFLMKLRILQLLSTSQIFVREEVMAHLQNLGYNLITDIMVDDALLALRFSGFVFVFIEEGYTPVEKVDTFRLSNRGRSIVKCLAYDPAYLEHVFHQSMFPQEIVRCVIDNTREDNLGNWIASSIRNYFAIFCYVAFLESNISEEYSIWKLTPELKKRITKAVVRIVRADRRKGGPIVSKALELIDMMVDDWRNQGLIS